MINFKCAEPFHDISKVSEKMVQWKLDMYFSCGCRSVDPLEFPAKAVWPNLKTEEIVV